MDITLSADWEREVSDMSCLPPNQPRPQLVTPSSASPKKKWLKILSSSDFWFSK